MLPFVVVLSAPEGWWSGGCGVPALRLGGFVAAAVCERRAVVRRLKYSGVLI